MKNWRRRNRKFRIGIDCDGILADLHQPWIDWYNKIWNDNLQITDLVWDIESVVKPECGTHIFDFLRQEDLYKDIKPYPQAMETLKKLKKAGHEIVIITHPYGGVETIPSKSKWLNKYLPKCIPRENIIYTGQKHLVKFDIFIDDSPHNIIAYRNAWRKSRIITIEWPFNLDVKWLTNLYATGYLTPKKAWKQIFTYIKKLSAIL